MPKVRGCQLQLRVPAAAGGPPPDARHHGSTNTTSSSSGQRVNDISRIAINSVRPGGRRESSHPREPLLPGSKDFTCPEEANLLAELKKKL